MTTIDGVDIHFIRVKSRHSSALPLIITHGWPGSHISGSTQREQEGGIGHERSMSYSQNADGVVLVM